MATRELWPEQTPEQLKRESDCLRHIAAVLGAADDWDDASDYLEAIATIITARTGLPHPGSEANTAAYKAVR